MTEETLFHLAVQQPASERAAFLEKMCAGDDALRQRVAALLRAADNPGDFLAQQPSLDETTEVEMPSGIGPASPSERIGRYQLLQPLGEGGMGTVFLAEQTEPVQRRVALKVVKAGLDSRQIIARFEAERQALALMDHPNVAKVHDAGTTDAGQPYFVMELVSGQPLTEYCDEHRLTPRQRLELFMPVCRAVQHAHQKGIIHRDLKPSNVLVGLYDGQPVPKVIDFGVAKATGGQLPNQAAFTGFGALVGTLEYMSPEQAEPHQLDVDTRSDIYSLGVMLYELLTGTTPLGRKRLRSVPLLECLRLIREEEPPKPSTRLTTVEELPSIAAKRSLEPKKLSRVMRGDLDWIVMKCLEKDRNRRYDTANGLALDVQRYLADEPVSASPPSAAYRLRKFVRRHQARVLAVTAVVIALVLVGSGLGWVGWSRGVQRTRTAQAVNIALAKAAAAEERANRMPCTTRQEATAKLVEWREAAAALAEAEAALTTGTATNDLREHFANVRQRIEPRATQTQRTEKLFRNLDEARMATAVWAKNQFNNAGAAEIYEVAFVAYDLAVTPDRIGELARRIRVEEPAVREALLAALDDWAYVASRLAAPALRALAAEADEDEWRKRYRDAEADDKRLTLRALSVEARRSEAPPSSLVLLARSLASRGEREEALTLLRWGRSRYPTDFWLHFELGMKLERGKNTTPLEVEEAIGCYRAALTLRPDASAVHNNLGIALMDKKQPDEAIDEYRTAIALDSKLANAHNNLGVALMDKEQCDKAIVEYRKAITLDPKLANAHNNLGVALLDKQQWDEAIAEHRRAIELDPKLATAHTNLGIALMAKKQLDQAIAEYRKAIELDSKDSLAHYNLGLAQMDKQHLDEAIVEFRQATELDPRCAAAYYNLGSALYARKQVDEAIAAYRQAIELDSKHVKAHINLGNAMMAKKDWDEAITEYRQAIELDPKDAGAHYNLGSALTARQQLDLAVAAYRKAIEVAPTYAEAYCNLGAVLQRQGHFVEALASYRRGHELGSTRPDWRYPSAAWVRLAERLAAVEEKLPAFQKGEYQPRDNSERLILTQVCQVKKLYRTAAVLYADTFAADPKLADDLKVWHRYNAACSAALAAAGKGLDTDKLDNAERTRLRQQALDWLRADLKLRSRRLEESKPEDRKAVQDTLRSWQIDTNLTTVRDPEALKKLPAEEQEAWRNLWADVADLLKKAGDAK